MDKKSLNYTILSVDTSTQNLSMCLYKKEIFYEENIFSEDHSENLINMLDKILKKTKTKLKDLTYIATNIGPGSFTGLRIGLSFVKTLALNLNLKIITTTSFGILIKEFLNNLDKIKNFQIMTLFPSVKNEFYVCKFALRNENLKQKIYPECLEINKLKNLIKKFNEDCLIIAPNFVQQQNFLTLKKVNFSSKNIIRLFLEKKYKNIFSIVKPQKLSPLYIRKTYY